MENFLEYYHLPAVHPALCNVSGVDEHRREQGTGMYCCFATDPLTAGGTAIDPGRLPVFSAIEGTSHATTAYHCAIFPNVFFSVYPDHFYRVIVDPISPTTSIERATLFTTKVRSFVLLHLMGQCISLMDKHVSLSLSDCVVSSPFCDNEC